ncbi:MAG: AI-2E family transporter [Methanospirillum sp.]
MTVPVAISSTTERLLLAALLLVIALGIQMASDVVTILVVSFILTLLALPAVDFLERRGLPHGIAVAVVSVVAFLVLLGLIGLLVTALEMLVADIGTFQAELDQRIDAVLRALDQVGLALPAFSASSIDLGAMAGAALGWIADLGDLLMTIFFVVITTFFMLLEAPQLPKRVARLLGPDSTALDQASRMSGFVIDFMVVRTETNLVHGVAFGGILLAMGVHAAVLWGILTFLLGYIPYLGLIAAAIPAIFFAWIQYGVPGALAVIVAVIVLNLIVENPVFSYFASRTFEIPPVLVVLAVIVFGWLLGVLGMLFAVPLMLMVLILVQASEETRWINVLLGVDRLFENGTGS